LVDTSAWIDYLRDTDDAHVRRLHSLLEPPSPVVLTPVVFQELLQGARDHATFNTHQAFFGSQPSVFPAHPVSSHIEAARIYQRCRQAGITIRSTSAKSPKSWRPCRRLRHPPTPTTTTSCRLRPAAKRMTA
jgi:predicted nucleic acid-binding protein